MDMNQYDKIYQTFKKWFISSDGTDISHSSDIEKLDWFRTLPFVLIHLGCLFVFVVGFSWAAFLIAFILYFVRGISISAFYHRYLAHRAFKTNRLFQFIFALLGTTAMQKGPLWWVSYHRNHHQYTDQIKDVHSPTVHGFFMSHIGWVLSNKNFSYDASKVKDLLKFPELILLDKYCFFVQLLLAIGLFMFGNFLQQAVPSWNTTGWQVLIWGYFISTIFLFHATASVNSITHLYGNRRFNTKDSSRNNVLVALFSFGEGWHNNHHYCPASVRIGFRWWEIDVTYYFLKLLEKCGIIWDVKYPALDISGKSIPLAENTDTM